MIKVNGRSITLVTQLCHQTKIKFIRADQHGTVWIGTFDGIVSFDGTKWKSRPGWGDCCLAIDKNNEKWFGYYDSGLEVVRGSKTTYYSTERQNLPSDKILYIAIDNYGTRWLGFLVANCFHLTE